ncbi:unnamed protein product [Pedinophyceae sp. YPF-701]|nr:unnamed protein product [Pedinophyceae sp. YPF-701]
MAAPAADTGPQASFWASTSWFTGCTAGPSIEPCRDLSTGDHPVPEPTAAPGPDPEHDAWLEQAVPKVGGAAAQSRFGGTCHIPIFHKAPDGGAPVASESRKRAHRVEEIPRGAASAPQRTQAPPRAGVNAMTGSALPAPMPGVPRRCAEGAAPVAVRPGNEARWEFDFAAWAWVRVERGAEADTARAELAARKWGATECRDALRASVRAAAPAAGRAASPDAARAPPRKVRKVPSEHEVWGSGDAQSPRVAGRSEQKRELREAVFLPLLRPGLVRALGVAPPTGVLLHGLPGAGKTELARAAAHQAGVFLKEVPCAEIASRGEKGLEALHRAFHVAAANAPSVLLLDDVDALAPSDKASLSQSPDAASLATELSVLLSRLRSGAFDGTAGAARDVAPRVAVLATATAPARVAASLRRAGRFDREIGLGQLPRGDRRAVLDAILARAPLAPCVDLDAVAGLTQGYLPSDLEGLCGEAALRAVSKAADAYEAAVDADGPPPHVRLTAEHFAAALRVVRGPAALRGWAVAERPDVDWDDIGGLEAVKAELCEMVELPLRHPEKLDRYGVRASRGALLHGPPGCGKTMLAKAVAAQCGASFISIRGPELLDPFLGESERGVRELFAAARNSAPCVVFFDEVDAIGGARGAQDSTVSDGIAARVLNQILVELDGVGDRNGVFVLAATNRPDALDPALVRPGRFDSVVEIPLPDAAGRLAVLRAASRRMPLATDVDLQALADATDGASGATMAEVCRRAGMAALRDFMRAGTGDVVAAQHFQSAMESFTPPPADAPAADPAARTPCGSCGCTCASERDAPPLDPSSEPQLAAAERQLGSGGAALMRKLVQQAVVRTTAAAEQGEAAQLRRQVRAQEAYVSHLQELLKQAGVAVPDPVQVGDR